ncbi:type II toxin-antitoxin system HicB family antitoxin [Syntrophothermus lipocalidus]|uniref:type II toxin-antitoxin system HicB family antitoxin n=1 Tax=Syntrophothermus lipocalidus TaxID=86170 RepID=UPI001F60D863|nr:type II toxin-antitoxin system HicB family antitoxin [Syntrophothermus lipocalidus]
MSFQHSADPGRRRQVDGRSSCASRMCHLGSTKEEALERIKEAIELYLEVMAQEGKPIPTDRPFQ